MAFRVYALDYALASKGDGVGSSGASHLKMCRFVSGGRIIIRPGRSGKGPTPIPGRDGVQSATDPPPSLQVHRPKTLLPPPSLQQSLHPKETPGLISVPT